MCADSPLKNSLYSFIQLLTLQLPAAPVAAHIRSWAQLCHWGVQRHLCQATTPVTQHTLLKDEASLQNSEPPRNPLSTQTASQHMAISPSMPIPPKVKEILHSLRTGSRSSLAEAITLGMFCVYYLNILGLLFIHVTSADDIGVVVYSTIGFEL